MECAIVGKFFTTGNEIATLVRKPAHKIAKAVEFRQVWGAAKLQELLDTAEDEPAALYKKIVPPLELGLPFIPVVVGAEPESGRCRQAIEG